MKTGWRRRSWRAGRWGMPGLVAALVAAGAEGRTWTSRSGATLEAELVRRTGDTVVLRRPDGSEVTIAVAQLAEESRALLPAAPATAAPASSRAAYLRPDEKVVAQWTNAAWEAVLAEPRGRLLLFPKGAGAPLEAAAVANHLAPGRTEWQPVAFRAQAAPAEVTERGVRFQLQYAAGLRAEVFFRQEGGDLLCGCRFEGEVKALGDHVLGLQFNVPAVHRSIPQEDRIESVCFPAVRTWADLAPLLAGWEVVNDPLKGARQRFPFAEPVQGVTYDSRLVEIAGPFAPWRLRFAKVQAKSASVLQLYLYEGTPPAQGFRILLRRPDEEQEDPVTSERHLVRLSFAPPR